MAIDGYVKPLISQQNSQHDNLKNSQFNNVVGVGLVQGWGTVCRGVLGIPLLENTNVCYVVIFMFSFMFYSTSTY